MPFTFGINIASLKARGNLEGSSKALEDTFTRLATGLRINRVSDDSAGAMLAADLKTDSRVIGQGIRNVSDGISLLTVYDSALSSLTDITTRLIELSEQAGNGVLTTAQREALNSEASALTNEYNRIISTTKFNGQSLFSSSGYEVSIQAGYGEENTLRFSLGNFAGSTSGSSPFSSTVGDGTFGSAAQYKVGTAPRGVVVNDFDGDGFMDIATSDKNSSQVSILHGNGNGTFTARTAFTTGTQPLSLQGADLNGDGQMDLVTANYVTDNISVLISNGNGTFLAKTDYAASDEPYDLTIGDVNSDGNLDIIAANSGQGGGGDSVTVFLGAGNGTFGAGTTFSALDFIQDIELGDYNGDGTNDLLVLSPTASDLVGVMVGNGNGTFSAPVTQATTGNANRVVTADFDGDGILDLAANQTSATLIVMLGNGNNTFKTYSSFNVSSSAFDVQATDLDGDGNLDLVSTVAGGGGVNVLLGNGNGTFQANTSYSTVSFTREVTFGDLDGDGGTDIVAASYGDNSVAVLLANTTTTTGIQNIDLSSQSSALTALDSYKQQLSTLAQERGVAGAALSRLEITYSSLQNYRSNLDEAHSKVVDADIALEVAESVRLQILQQAATAVIAQANLSSEVVLGLLG